MARTVTYKKAGVDIDRTDRFIDRITPIIRKTATRGVLGGIGGFGGFFKADLKGMKDPILVGATDGVGTKLLVADVANRHDTVGIDLVAMNVNDVLTSGARPIFFLDYFATGRIDAGKAVSIMRGIVEGCRRAGCALIGGETAEMPGLYRGTTYDLAGFCVGIVDRKDIIDGSSIRAGDSVVGIASSGVHSNGYSLVRRLFTPSEMKGEFKKALLEPTIIYVKPVLGLMKRCEIKGIAHITGGGFYENIPRVLPEGTAVSIEKSAWKIPAIFEEIRERSGASERELFRTFNMGIGMVLILAKADVDKTINYLAGSGLKAHAIGRVIKWPRREVIISKTRHCEPGGRSDRGRNVRGSAAANRTRPIP